MDVCLSNSSVFCICLQLCVVLSYGLSGILRRILIFGVTKSQKSGSRCGLTCSGFFLLNESAGVLTISVLYRYEVTLLAAIF